MANSSSTPLLLITSAGLAAASQATPTGPYINITSFQIGSGVGYTPTTTQTSIQGNLLYSGTPTSYTYIGNNTIDILCTIPPDAGPWPFGEVALFLEDGTMFAIAVFSTAQSKFSSLGTNVVSSYNLNCLIQLAQSTAVFQVTTIAGTPDILDQYNWSDVYPPGVSPNPNVPMYVVRELNSLGEATILENASTTSWTVGSTSYRRYYGSRAGNEGSQYFTVASASASWVQIPASFLNTQDLAVANRVFLLETSAGYFRSVNSVTAVGSNYQFNLNVTNDGTYANIPLPIVPTNGSTVQLYRCDVDNTNIFYDQIVNPPTSVPSGTILPFAGSSVPSGFLLSNGSAISRSSYATLYATIGTTYGSGDGSTTFNIPDCRGVFLRGLDNGRGLDPSRVLGTYQADAFASHNHGLSDPGHVHGVSDPGHAHGIYDPGHNHGVADPGHLHSVNDPGHLHYTYPPNGIGNGGGGQALTEQGTSKTNPTTAAATGVSINGAFTGISIATGYTNISTYAAVTNITLATAYTGISVQPTGTTETRAKNIAINYIIKY